MERENGRAPVPVGVSWHGTGLPSMLDPRPTLPISSRRLAPVTNPSSPSVDSIPDWSIYPGLTRSKSGYSSSLRLSVCQKWQKNIYPERC
ncbi:hypothetical protein L204_102297 [Cryptococcus depauperatus]